jgi:hypothetical protein
MVAGILAVASLIVAVVAAGAAAKQAYLLRFSLQVQSLLAVETAFNARELRRARHLAARQLLTNTPGPEVDDVLNFFATVALLVRRRALDAEMVWHVFFYWLRGYWHTARAYVDQERETNPRVWEDVPPLYARLLAIETHKGIQREEEPADFLEAEVEQYDPETPPS